MTGISLLSVLFVMQMTSSSAGKKVRSKYVHGARVCVNDRGFKSKVVVRIFVFTFVILKGKTPKTT